MKATRELSQGYLLVSVRFITRRQHNKASLPDLVLFFEDVEDYERNNVNRGKYHNDSSHYCISLSKKISIDVQSC